MADEISIRFVGVSIVMRMTAGDTSLECVLNAREARHWSRLLEKFADRVNDNTRNIYSTCPHCCGGVVWHEDSGERACSICDGEGEIAE